MRCYKCDLDWISVRLERHCVRCRRLVHPGQRGFYYPEDRSLDCGPEEMRQGGQPEVFGARVRRGEQPFDVGSEGKCIRQIVAVAVRK